MSTSGDGQDGGDGKLMLGLFGGAIMLVVMVVFASGGDEVDDKGDPPSASSSARTNKSGSASGVSSRAVDAANSRQVSRPTLSAAQKKEQREEADRVSAEQEKARAITVESPPEFDTKEDELAWWNGKLDTARQLQQRRLDAMDLMDVHEAKLQDAEHPAKSRALFEKKKATLQGQIQMSVDELAIIEAKMAEL